MALTAGPAIADENNTNSEGLPLFVTTSYQNEYGWRHDAGDYREPVAPLVEPQAGDAAAQVSLSKQQETLKKEQGKSYKEKDYLDKVLKKLPYSKRLKSTWKLIDGDTDVYVEGLRLDRGNTGVTYTTSTVPFIGDVDGLEMKAEMGQDSKLKLKSSHVPFVGKVEGLEFKSSVGEEQAVSIRYTTSLEKLGL